MFDLLEPDNIIQKQRSKIIEKSPFDSFVAVLENQCVDKKNIQTLKRLIQKNYHSFSAQKFDLMVRDFFAEIILPHTANNQFLEHAILVRQSLNQLKVISSSRAIQILDQHINEMAQLGLKIQNFYPDEARILQSLVINLKFWVNQFVDVMNYADSSEQRENVLSMQLKFFCILHSQDEKIMAKNSLDWTAITARVDLALLAVGIALLSRPAPNRSYSAQNKLLFFSKDTVHQEQVHEQLDFFDFSF